MEINKQSLIKNNWWEVKPIIYLNDNYVVCSLSFKDAKYLLTVFNETQDKNEIVQVKTFYNIRDGIHNFSR